MLPGAREGFALGHGIIQSLLEKTTGCLPYLHTYLLTQKTFKSTEIKPGAAMEQPGAGSILAIF